MIQHRVIGIMYTRTCPMACAHCISESSPKVKERMTLAQARHYLPAIRRFSQHVSFTGGEALLFHRDIIRLTEEARHIGLEVSLVSGAGWVKGEAMARVRVNELATAGISRMVVSWDVYHEEFAPRENALLLARLACEAGIAVDLRTVLPAHRQLEDYHAPFRELPVRFESTTPLQLGTASTLPTEHFHWRDSPPKGVCDVVLRPVIEPDGTVYACCGPGHFSRRPSPLVLGNAEETPLEEILARGARDPVLEAISVIGPHGLYRLLDARRNGGPRVALRPRYTGVCELCLDINGSPDLVAALRERLEDTDAQMMLAAARMWLQNKKQAAAADDGAAPAGRAEAHSDAERHAD